MSKKKNKKHNDKAKVKSIEAKKSQKRRDVRNAEFKEMSSEVGDLRSRLSNAEAAMQAIVDAVEGSRWKDAQAAGDIAKGFLAGDQHEQEAQAS